ncbi:MAG: aldehyde dehydrogenase [Bacteroidota bacterium]
MRTLSNYINGQLLAPSKGQYLDVYDPSRGVVYGKVPASDKEDLELAFQAAQKAFPAWKALPALERSTYLAKIADLIDQRLDVLARAESQDNGKPVSLAKSVDIPRASANFRFFSQAITQFASESHHMHNGINYTLRQPLGVVGTISPWNLPLYLFTWKIAPALAAGNTVIAKPSEVTPLTAFLLSEICIEVGLPAGVLNIIHGQGPDVGGSMTLHPGIKAISFTGSTRVGREISKIASPMFKKLSLEMGGKNPNIIFSDCDFDRMMDTTMRSSFANQGQICLCGSRIYVEKNLYDTFKDEFVKRSRELVVGPPQLGNSHLGAVVSEVHYKKILSFLNQAKKEGGRILCGGKAVHPAGYEKGWYIAPTIIEGLPQDGRCMQEEIFGPVVSIASFEAEEEVVQLANGTKYGLSATLWTQNLSRAHRMSEQLEAGIVWVNTWMQRDLRTPFGGVKQSGVGREGGFDALRFFTEPKNVCINY